MYYLLSNGHHFQYKQMSQSSKRMPCGEGKRSHGEVKVFTLSEIENQYMVINMLLKHAKLNPTNQVLGKCEVI